MATLKLISTRLKSVKNIQKITQSMKMIAAARYAKAEKELKNARDFGVGATALYEKLGVDSEEPKKNHLLIAVSSDRGLCGGIHSNISKAVKQVIEEKQDSDVKLLVIGEKAKTQLQRTHSDYIVMSVSDYGRKPPTFEDASRMIAALYDSGYDFESAEILYNKFRSVVSYKTTSQPIVPFETLSESEKIGVYDDVDSDILRNYSEFQLTSILYSCLMESNTSEQSSRMTAMDNASKNAGEMIDKLTLQFNRTRQAVITRELIEIISGAAAL